MTNWPYSAYSKINIDVAKNFPFKEARKNQLETISEIKEAIDSGYKYIILEAGTGTGKSAIAATLALMFDSSYILTVTKQLQDQYINDFSNLGFKLVKGRGNFKCKKYVEDNVDLNCDQGRCVIEGYKCKYSLKNHSDEEITEENTCSYFYQKLQAMTSDVAIANYPYMFLELNYVDDFTHRNLMICDEAHNIESTIMKQLTLEFEKKDLKDYIKFDVSDEVLENLETGSYHDWIDFIIKIKNKYKEELEKIINIKNKPELNEKIVFMKRQINDCRSCISYIDYDPKMWIFDFDENNEIIQFKPLKINNYANNTFFQYADVCIFMSATILDYRLFAHWLGISQDEIYAIRQKSPFDVKRNPIFTFDGFNMSHNHINESAPQTIDTIKCILERHKNEKGIIHTISGKCRDYLLKNIDEDRLIHHNVQNRAEIIEKFKNSSEPLVLVSPSVNEGVDLPGDECRFQIIYKIPYPDLGDKQISYRNRLDAKWYDYSTSLSLVQTHGRGMRYDEDYCKTYFIDSRFINYVVDDGVDNHFLPDSFKEAIDKLSEVKKDSYDEIITTSDNLTFKEKVEIKYELIKKGKSYLRNGEYGEAIEFYQELINHPYFKNDYHPYLKLAKALEESYFFEKEVEVLTSFFSAGIYCTKPTLKLFKTRLKELDRMGYFDYSLIYDLENKYQQKGFINKAYASKPVPLSKKIIEMKNKSKKASKPTYDASYFDSLTQMDENLSYEEKIDFKRTLIMVGKYFIKEKKYGDATEFFNRLKNHELFVNDYYPYKQLSFVYRKDGQFEDDERIVIEFFKSGIYCSDNVLAWFKNRLRLLYRMGVFDNSQMYDLENEFYSNGAKNQHLANTPVPTATRILND